MKKNRLAVALFVSAISLSALSPSYASKPAQDLPKLSQVSDGVFRGAQPTFKGLQNLKDSGIKTVVDLRNKPEQIAKEEAEVKRLGMNFVSIPLGMHRPSPEAIDKFLSLTKDAQATPLFVHCQYGVDRTGTLVAIYREEKDNWTADQAYKEMCDQGFHQSLAWMADAVFDWEKNKGVQISQNRPLSVRMFDTLHNALSFSKPTDKRLAQ